MSIQTDLRLSVRSLLRRPGFALASILAVALGIGATTAVFSVVDAVLLQRLPYERPERLVMVWETNPAKGEDESRTSPPVLLDLRNQVGSFGEVAAYWLPEVTLGGDDGEPERLRLAETTANLFPLLGARPALGRGFRSDEEGPGRAPQLLLSHALWQRRFGADPEILSRRLVLDGTPHTVIGVMPEGFAFPDDTEAWRTLALDPQVIGRGARFLDVVARLGDGADPALAQQQVDALARRLQQSEMRTNEGWEMRVVPLRDQLLGHVERALLLLFSAIGLVLLIAVVNVTNLTLVRGAARRGEIAMRTVLGSSRGRLVRIFVLESLLLTVVGGAVGLVLVAIGIHPLVDAVPAEIPRLDQVSVDWRAILFSLGLIALVGVFVGLVPALRFSAAGDLASSLKEGGRGGSRVAAVHSLLVVVEIAIAMTVLIGAGLILGSFNRLLEVETGFEPQGLLTFEVQLPAAKYPLGTPVTDFYRQAVEELEALPGVQSATVASFFPLDDEAWSLPFAIPGRDLAGEEPAARQIAAGEGYFEALGIPLREGRGFRATDTLSSPGVAVVNETLARRYWPDRSPLGETLVPGARNFGPLGAIVPETVRIVGVVGDVRNAGLTESPDPAIYYPQQQFAYRSMSFAVRTDTGRPMALAEEVRRRIWQLDPDMPLSDMAEAEQLVAARLARQRFGALLLSLFAGVALVLAALGIYGVVAYGVRQRRREIGIRMALGGTRMDVLWLVLKKGLRLVLLGLALGAAVALASGRLLRDLLYGITPTEPAVYVGIAAVLFVVAALAVLLPAREATRVEPASSLRYD